MELHYTKPDGSRVVFQLSEQRPILIGRNPEADVVIQDSKASRIHCGLRYMDGGLQIKDLKSSNGTYVNDCRVHQAKLAPGDRIQVGSVAFVIEQQENEAEIAVSEVEDEMAHGKGYETILKEIVNRADETKKPRQVESISNPDEVKTSTCVVPQDPTLLS